jgi:hypothetical protein
MKGSMNDQYKHKIKCPRKGTFHFRFNYLRAYEL